MHIVSLQQYGEKNCSVTNEANTTYSYTIGATYP